MSDCSQTTRRTEELTYLEGFIREVRMVSLQRVGKSQIFDAVRRGKSSCESYWYEMEFHILFSMVIRVLYVKHIY